MPSFCRWSPVPADRLAVAYWHLDTLASCSVCHGRGILRLSHVFWVVPICCTMKTRACTACRLTAFQNTFAATYSRR